MNNIYPIIISSIAGLSTLLGNILLFVPHKQEKKLLSFSFGLSFTTMLLISILELIPEGLKIIDNRFPFPVLFITSLFFLIIGYSIIIFIDKKLTNKEELYRVGVLSTISLLIHNIPEGVICAITSSINIKVGLSISIAILIHNIPEGISISLPIYYSTKSKKKAITYTFISGAGEVLGAIITIFILKPYITPLILYILFITTAGIMITLSITKILKEAINTHEYKYFVYGIIIGVIIIIYTI